MKAAVLVLACCILFSPSLQAQHAFCAQADSIALEVADEVSPIPNAQDGMPVLPVRRSLRRLLRVRIPGGDRIADAFWWPNGPHSFALFWRFDSSRSVFVDAGIADSLDLRGRMWLNHDGWHDGPFPFFAKHAACRSQPA